MMRFNPSRFSHLAKILRVLAILFFFLGTGSPAVADSNIIYLPLIEKNWVDAPGSITGRVTDAGKPGSDTNGVNGVRVCYRDICATTADQVINQIARPGYYTLKNIPPGYQVLNTTADTYEPQTAGVSVIGKQTVTLNIAITTQLKFSDIRFRFMVTWRPEQTWTCPLDNTSWPNDLDSQLWVVGPSYWAHIDPYYNRGECTNDPYACIEADATYGSGPETVDIQQLPGEEKYYFGVLNLNNGRCGVPLITSSMAQIQVYSQEGLLQTYQIPSSGDGNLWYAFQFDSAGTFTTTNCITWYAGDQPPQCPPATGGVPGQLRPIKTPLIK
jgi:hypothetical protein